MNSPPQLLHCCPKILEFEMSFTFQVNEEFGTWPRGGIYDVKARIVAGKFRSAYARTTFESDHSFEAPSGAASATHSMAVSISKLPGKISALYEFGLTFALFFRLQASKLH